jgi:carbon-monoxide dehydrogenase small subunit
VNGEPHSEHLSPTLLLTDYLRDHLRLTGTHVGCDTSQCGACTVLVDGLTVKACTVLAVSLDGACIETVESLSRASGLHPVQSAFRNRHALQCGFCTPGVMMTAVGLLRENPHPSAAEIREGLDGVICRCTGYENIVEAISEAAGAPAAGEAI